ncbi:hypothetical protein GIB67_017847 [Kingdonia uniflora]|uniref:Uncharacterized protein n=1 Tax=Kingdonia uniflora TaxID=39325 RepID=A0A7J7NUL5_9MAGN|nr:hypothetical protein GIB67_017847 [Kingdonia uniflora]
MAIAKVAAPKLASIHGVCNLCNDLTHYAHTCPQLPELINFNPDHINVILDIKMRQHQNNFSRFPWQNNPAFSWRNQPQGQSSYNPSPYEQNQTYPANQAHPVSLESILQQFITVIRGVTQQNSRELLEMRAFTHKLDTQIGKISSQLNEREKGKFPSQPIANPKATFKVHTQQSSLENIETT